MPQINLCHLLEKVLEFSVFLFFTNKMIHNFIMQTMQRIPILSNRLYLYVTMKYIIDNLNILRCMLIIEINEASKRFTY